EKSKADIDNEGLTLGNKKAAPVAEKEQGPPPKKEPLTESKRSLVFIVVATIVMVTIIALGTAIFLLSGKKENIPPASSPNPVALQPETHFYSTKEDVILDPFIVFFNPITKDRTGVLVARLSLLVRPETSANIEADLFDIRKAIVEKLTINVPIYSKQEIAAMLKEDLNRFNVKEATFIRYELH
ncbi:MAG: hypothetical protein U9P80_08370, partial [Thermodesulfobacteriota bacterium]|nr:hypothetical protein [Thermodesulfobacteriota bacterium]